MDKDSLRQKLREKINKNKMKRQSVESKINRIEKDEKKKDEDIFENENTQTRKDRRNKNRKSVKEYDRQTEVSLTSKQQQELMNYMKQQQELQQQQQEQERINKLIEQEKKENKDIEELNKLIDYKNNLDEKNGHLLNESKINDIPISIINDNINNSTDNNIENTLIDIVNGDELINPISSVNINHNQEPTINILNDLPVSN